eukprot:761550-Hanusia_phi.AAC.10
MKTVRNMRVSGQLAAIIIMISPWFQPSQSSSSNRVSIDVPARSIRKSCPHEGCSDLRLTFQRLRGGSSSSSDIQEKPAKRKRKFSAMKLDFVPESEEPARQSEQAAKFKEVYDEQESYDEDVEEISEGTLHWIGESWDCSN